MIVCVCLVCSVTPQMNINVGQKNTALSLACIWESRSKSPPYNSRLITPELDRSGWVSNASCIIHGEFQEATISHFSRDSFKTPPDICSCVRRVSNIYHLLSLAAFAARFVKLRWLCIILTLQSPSSDMLTPSHCRGTNISSLLFPCAFRALGTPSIGLFVTCGIVSFRCLIDPCVTPRFSFSLCEPCWSRDGELFRKTCTDLWALSQEIWI